MRYNIVIMGVAVLCIIRKNCFMASAQVFVKPDEIVAGDTDSKLGS